MDKSGFELLIEAFNKVATVVRPHLERVYRSAPADAVELIKKAVDSLTGKPAARERAPRIPPKRKGRDFKL